MITTLRALMEKVDNTQEQINNVNIYNPKDELKGDAKNKKHYYKNE